MLMCTVIFDAAVIVPDGKVIVRVTVLVPDEEIDAEEVLLPFAEPNVPPLLVAVKVDWKQVTAEAASVTLGVGLEVIIAFPDMVALQPVTALVADTV